MPCDCQAAHTPKRIVLTGGPGAGKTALLELIRQSFCVHVRILPEAASIVFGGGFPREADVPSRRAAQRAIYYVQRELEEAAQADAIAIVLCDRGTLDGLAYWPGDQDDFWRDVRSDFIQEVARYETVIHLQSPGDGQGYDHSNPLRIESASAAAAIDRRIQEVWASHPRRFVVPAAANFLDKCANALDILRGELPACCRGHVVRAIDERALGPQ